MINIYIILIVLIIIWFLHFIREVNNSAQQYATEHCERIDIQLLSLARRSIKLKYSKKHGIYWFSTFDLEFSGDRSSSEHAVLHLNNLKLVDIVMPVYRID